MTMQFTLTLAVDVWLDEKEYDEAGNILPENIIAMEKENFRDENGRLSAKEVAEWLLRLNQRNVELFDVSLKSVPNEYEPE